MPTSLIEGNSLLAIDIGAVTTRAAYFDVVEGRYRFISMGQSATTSAAPLKNVALGAQMAIENLQSLLGKALIDADGRLTVPSQPDGLGVDSVVTTISAGPAIRTIVIGLLADVSLKSIESLAQTTYTQIIDSIGLNDPRRSDEQIDVIVRHSPELIMIAGGMDGGATSSVQKVIETIGLATYLMPETKRPVVLYAGNKALAQEVHAALNGIASSVQISPNVRPSLQVEDLAPAQRDLAGLVIKVREQQMPQLEELRELSGGYILPSAYAQGRMIRFLSSYFASGKGVLSVDVGASAISIGASFDGDLNLNVFPQLGLGEPLAGLLRHTTLNDIARWIPLDIPTETVREYIYQKSLYPAAIPATPEELAIEQAILRQNLQLATRLMVNRLPPMRRRRDGLLPSFEPILASGASITGAATPGQKLLMLLDGLQPTGLGTLALDQNNLLSMLGAASELNSILPIQVIDSGALSSLATVISPVVGKVNFGTPIVQAKLTRNDGSEMEVEVQMGSLQILPLASGQAGTLNLRPLRRADIGSGPGRANQGLEVFGSSLGIVIDARGRPLSLPEDAAQRRALLKKWQTAVGG
jgi:hypothetical protein